MDVPHYHLLLGTSDGRVLVGTVAYNHQFLRFKKEDEPANLAALKMPTEEEFATASYSPEVLVQDGAVVEHLAGFGFYRTVTPVINIDRELEFESDGQAVTALASQVSEAASDEERETLTMVTTKSGRTWRVDEYIDEYDDMEEEFPEPETESIELTDELGIAPDFLLVNELRNRIVCASIDGSLVVIEGSRLDSTLRVRQRKNVFTENADIHNTPRRAWRDIINDDREDEGFQAMPGLPKLTSVEYLLGDETIIFADNWGGIQAWFTVQVDENAEKSLLRIRTHAPSEKAIVSIAPSPIHKSFLAIDETGLCRAINNTAQRIYVSLELKDAELACMTRKGDAVLIADKSGSVHHYYIEAPHAEASYNAYFWKVWYENYPEPKYEWQTSAGSDDVEPKMSLMPLIIGTLKGAFYALLFAMPLAILAAIYTSEFMNRRLRAIVKPAMEVMASLPSVVLGFLAALYFAPKASSMMPTIIVVIFLLPTIYMVFGWIWSRCPPSFVGKFGHTSSMIILFALFGISIGLSAFIGPRIEWFLFPASEGANPALLDPYTFEAISDAAKSKMATGDFRSWTDGGQILPRDTEVNGVNLPRGWWAPGGFNLLWLLLSIPVTLGLGLLSRKVINPLKEADKWPVTKIRDAFEGENKATLRAVGADALFSFGYIGILFIIGSGLSYIVAHGAEWTFFTYDHPLVEGGVGDFRRFIVGEEGWKFEAQNSLIVGFAMGFAVIPIIYTISEDAMTSVPNQLRAASLACGASRWQTTIRVVLPASIAGIFSGIVIGLGRALGETMIVVMAAGGTPITEMQPLSGFRSLSMAIAIEMPEAPHGGTLYRTLFLAGFLLFCMTVVINTLAEAVRIRLRRKLSRL
ncbi:MAG: ABC transporter permease subunit [Planctomycetes bacterium]|nr:ABC transporter permease subunit [Planctomycetota bacterium]